MDCGTNGHPGVCARPHVAVDTVIASVPANSPRMEANPAAALPNRPSSATLLSAQVSKTLLFQIATPDGTVHLNNSSPFKLKLYSSQLHS